MNKEQINLIKEDMYFWYGVQLTTEQIEEYANKKPEINEIFDTGEREQFIGNPKVKNNRDDLILYKNFKKKKEIEKLKRKQLKEFIKKNKIEIIKYNLLMSKINFNKFGWVNKAAKIINIRPQKVNIWMKKNMNKFYYNNCFIRIKN